MALVNKKFQELITFSRASSGTYVNSNGYITNSSVLNYLTYSNQPENAAWTKSNSFIQTNLLLYSQDFTSWTLFGGTPPVITPNVVVAPDGTLTADQIYFPVTGSGSRVQYVLGTTVLNTVSIWLRGTVGGEQIQIWNGWATINQTVTLTTSWQRFAFSEASVSASTGIYLYAAVGTPTVYAWGAQVVQGSVPGDYRATTTAALPVLYPDYNGALRARKLVTNSGTATVVAQSMVNNPSLYSTTEDRVLTVYAKSDGLRYLLIGVHNGGGFTITAVFDLVSGIFVAAGGHPTYGNAINNSITSVGNGWYRCSTVIDAFDTNAKAPYIVGSSTYGGLYNRDCTGDGSSGIYIADAQLVAGSVVTDYADNTTGAAIYAPRFDYDPVTLAAKGLLVEEQRTNLLLRSQDWSATWINSNITQTAGAALGPDGQMSMTKLEATTSTNTTCRQQLVATSTAHTFSVYVKQGSGATQANLFAVYNNTTATNIAVLNFNYSTGVVTQTTGTGATAINVGNSIWRIIIPVTSGITVGNTITVYPLFSGAVETAGEFAYVYGAQVEAGAFATSYIPTVASQVTRAGDLATVNTLLPWFNQAAGTIYSEFDAYGGTNLNRFYEFAGATSSNTINGFLGPSTVYMEWVTTGGAPQAQLNAAGSPTAVNKVGAAYKENDFAASLNGATPVTDAGGTIPVISTLYLGNSVTGSQQLNGHLRRITYYPQRLSNAQLQSITT